MVYTKEARDERSEFLLGSGCQTCSQTGYMGRMGLFEVLRMTDEVRTLLSKGTTTTELRAEALKEGMVTLLRDGMM